jgi:hypothetical protein
VKPKVLIAATDRWYPTARLAMALANAGCVVEALCPSGHPVAKTSAARRIHDYNGLMPLASFARAIRDTDPNVVIPSDDLATRHLHQLYNQERRRGKRGFQVCGLIERSLGSAESFEVVYSRAAFMQLAAEEGVRVPKTEVVTNTNDLRNWITRMGFPTVLKANGTSGGDGVRVVNTAEEAERAFRKLQAPPMLARAVKWALVDRDLTLIWPSLFRRRHTINAQAFVAGNEATSTIACWNGSVLASLHFEVLQKVGPTGHATVVRLIEHPEMSSAAEKIARRLKLSGLHGLDFMLEALTGNAYLIEMNPRVTQVGHLALGRGRDLPAALYAALTGRNVQPAREVIENDTIALFPQEWTRDPASPLLLSGYHDVPWEEPALVRACVSKVRKQRAQNLLQTRSAPVVYRRSTGEAQGAAQLAEQKEIRASFVIDLARRK